MDLAIVYQCRFATARWFSRPSRPAAVRYQKAFWNQAYFISKGLLNKVVDRSNCPPLHSTDLAAYELHPFSATEGYAGDRGCFLQITRFDHLHFSIAHRGPCGLQLPLFCV